VDAEAVVTARVDERGHDAHGGIVSLYLHIGVDVDLVPADARLGGAIHVIGPVVRARETHAGPDRPALVDPDCHCERHVDEGVLPRRGVVVGVAEVAAVHQSAVAGCASSAKVPVAGSTSTRTSPLVIETEPSLSLISTGWASGAGSKAAQP